MGHHHNVPSRLPPPRRAYLSQSVMMQSRYQEGDDLGRAPLDLGIRPLHLEEGETPQCVQCYTLHILVNWK